MRVLFVLENYYPHIGGVEVVFKTLAEGLAARGHTVDIITHQLKNTKRFERINGVKVHRVPSFFSRYWFTLLGVPKAVQLARKADIIHTTTFNGAFPAWLAAKLRGKKCVITIHEVWQGKWQSYTEMGGLSAAVHNLLEKCIYLLNFDKYVSVSHSTQKQLLGVGIKKNRATVVYNGVDYAHWNPKKYSGVRVRRNLGLQKNFVLLFTGRPGVSKGLQYLIKAMPDILKKIPHAKLLALVSQDKTYRARYHEIEQVIQTLKIQDKVILHDPVPYKELPGYVKAADAVVVPSLAEGFGFSAAEACAMGKIVIASNTTSLPEVVSGQYLLVKPRSPAAIAEAAVKAMQKKVKKTKLKRFLVKDNIAGYLKVYRSVLK